MDGPERRGFRRPSCRFRGRSQPAPAARVIPAGRLVRADGTARAPVFVGARLPRTDGGWCSVGSFDLNDLPDLALLAHRAYAVDDLTPDSREACNLPGVALAEASVSLRSLLTMRYPS